MTTIQPYTQEGRITSLFGVYLPPKKKQIPTRHLTITFILTGTVPSKKNMIWADSNINLLKGRLYKFKYVKECIDWLLSSLKVFVRNSKKYNDWVDENKPIIQEQARSWVEKFKGYDFSYPLNDVTVKVYHYWTDNMERDLTNKMDSLNDLLVSAGIIVNDSWQYVKRITSEGENYRDQIVKPITRIDITQSFYD